MASIIKKKKKGRYYYYAVKSARVNGKPRIVWQKYLGTVDSIIKRTETETPPVANETVIFEAGGVAALLGITQRLKLIELIDEVIPKRDQGPSIGEYITLAAINRALAPCSKVGIGKWYEQSVLYRLWRYPTKTFSSQRFWDHMDKLSEDAILSIQEKLASRISDEFGLDRNVLLYDTTNFFSFLATTNDRNKIAQRGHSKAKRHDLRQVGLALLVSIDFQVPLFHLVYSGNRTDMELFPEITRDLIRRYNALFGQHEITIAFDKGNVSDQAMLSFVKPGCNFVTALPSNQAKQFLSIPIKDLKDIPGMPGTRATAIECEFWDRNCTAVITYTESFFTQQLSGVTVNLVKCQKRLMDLENSLKRWKHGKGRGKKPSIKSVESKVKEILNPQFMKLLFNVSIKSENGCPELQYKLNHEALDMLINQRLGRTVLITNHTTWSDKKIIETYRNLAWIEQTFKTMKNTEFLHWQPAFHWTEQKVRVHGLYCVLALLLTTLARKIIHENGIEMTIPALLKDITAIKEVAIIYPKGTMAHRKNHIALSRLTPRQKKLSEFLDIPRILSR